jgi:ferritin-like metal-binding protein YciE
MRFDSLKQIYVSELQEQRSAEEQLIQALPKMSEMAHDAALGAALQEHLRETRTQLDRLDEVLSRHGAEPREHRDRSMETILGEAGKWAMMIDDPEPRDAAMIASAQRIEHYEIAVYGTLATWAKQLGLNEDMRVLLSILEEEKAADAKLTELAKKEVNREAVR